MARAESERAGGGAACGFTLVELMVVIAIIGVLMAILIPVVGKVRRAAYGAETSAQMATIANGIQQYYGDFKAYPGPLPNSECGIAYYPSGNYTATSAANAVYVLDPNSSTPTTPIPIKLGTGTGTSETFATFPPDMNGTSETEDITGAENLVLGLLGGLEITFPTTTPANGIYTIADYAYNPANIFPDGVTPSPKGAMNLNPNNPKRVGPYIQVKPGDITAGGMNPAEFADASGRTALDSIIPEFLDKYSNPMPILYLRANVGGTAVVGLGGQYGDDKTALVDSVTNAQVVPQYDLAQIQGYTGSKINTNPSGNQYQTQHGLQMPVSGSPFLAFGSTASGADTIKSAFPTNACVYFKDPSINYDPTNNPNLSDTHGATARQQNAYILISAGPDGIYGTPDDVIYPGSLNP